MINSVKFSRIANASRPGHSRSVDASERPAASKTCLGAGLKRPPVKSRNRPQQELVRAVIQQFLLLPIVADFGKSVRFVQRANAEQALQLPDVNLARDMICRPAS